MRPAGQFEAETWLASAGAFDVDRWLAWLQVDARQWQALPPLERLAHTARMLYAADLLRTPSTASTLVDAIDRALRAAAAGPGESAYGPASAARWRLG